MAVRIYLEIGHEASLRTKKTQEGFTHDWEVFVRGCDGAEIHYYIEKVVFYLHETFPKPKRVVKEPPYSVKESGYAGFNLPIDIYLRNSSEPKKIRFNYDLHLQQSGPPILKVQKEKYVFNNPTDEFKMKVLKGGGTIGSSSSSQEIPDNRSNMDDKNQLTNKPKLSGCDIMKKPKIKPGEFRDFQELFGSPITMSSKTSSEPKIQSTKPESKPRTKHSPHKDSHKDKDKSKDKSESEKKSKDEKKQKEKTKDRERSKDKNVKKDKSPRPKSPSPKKASPPRFSSPPVIKHKDSKHDRERKDKSEDKKVKKEKKKEHKTDEQKVNNEEHKRSETKKEVKTKTETSTDTKPPRDKGKEKSASHSEKYKHKKKDKEKRDKKDEKSYKSEKKIEPKQNLFKVETQPKKEKVVPAFAPIDEESSNSSTSSSRSSLVDKKPKTEVVKVKEDKNQKLKKEKGYQENTIKCKRKSNSVDVDEPPEKLHKDVSLHSDAEQDKEKETKPTISTPKEVEEDYFGLLRDLQHKIMGLKDNSDLQKVVKLIAETGRYEVSAHTFDFDLCLLDRSTVQQLQDFFASET